VIQQNMLAVDCFLGSLRLTGASLLLGHVLILSGWGATTTIEKGPTTKGLLAQAVCNDRSSLPPKTRLMLTVTPSDQQQCGIGSFIDGKASFTACHRVLHANRLRVIHCFHKRNIALPTQLAIDPHGSRYTGVRSALYNHKENPRFTPADTSTTGDKQKRPDRS
jgi:hypothetical protein